MGQARLISRSSGHAQLGRSLGQRFSRFERDALPVAPPLNALLAPGIFDENATHRLGRRGEEMSAVIPVSVGAVVSGQPQKSFVNQGRRLKGLSWQLVGEHRRRQPAQLNVDQRQQLLRGVRITLLNLIQQPRYFDHGDYRTTLPRAHRPSPRK